MKKIKNRCVISILTCCSLIFLCGCSSVMCHTGSGQGYYPGTRANASMLTDSQTSWVLKPLALLDMPFSIVMDTLLLPWDYARTHDGKSNRSLRDRIQLHDKKAKKP